MHQKNKYAFVISIIFIVASVTTMIIMVSTNGNKDKDIIDPTKFEIIHTIQPEFLSFTIDYARYFGEDWWNPNEQVNTSLTGGYNLDKLEILNTALIEKAQQLSPAHVIFSGSATDEMLYEKDAKHVLVREDLKNIDRFAKETSNTLFLSLSSGNNVREQKKYSKSSHEELLVALAEEGVDIEGFIFGNEPNAFVVKGLNHIVFPDTFAADSDVFTQQVKKYNSNSKIVVGSSAFWPIAGEFIPFTKLQLQNTKTSPDIVAFHYYPQQSSRCFFKTRAATKKQLLNPKNLNEIKRHAQYVKEMRDQYQPQADLWLSETGHAQCGGQKDISDTFYSTIWWMDQLGVLAELGYDVVGRQTLIGSDYGLLSDDIKPRPDFWASVMFKEIVGTNVFLDKSIQHIDENIRIYSFSLNQDYIEKEDNRFVSMVINLSSDDEKIEIHDSSNNNHRYELTAKNQDKKELYVNNNPASKNYSKQKEVITREVQLSPESVSFIVY